MVFGRKGLAEDGIYPEKDYLVFGFFLTTNIRKGSGDVFFQSTAEYFLPYITYAEMAY